jgi:hypothetical protein
MEQNGPFVFGSLAESEHFTNRITELNQLATNFLNGTNTTLISPRRWGKSSLVKTTAERLIKKHRNIRVCYVDLFNTRTEHEFYTLLAQQVVKGTATKMDERMAVVKNFFGRLIPSITFSPDERQEFSLGFSVKELKKNADEILGLAEAIAKKNNYHIILCIDEFQNIEYFEQSLAFQKKLRSHWQTHKHVTYCLYGSKKHMLMDIFGTTAMPFYRFGDMMFLEKIKTVHWLPFIVGRFEKTGKKISTDTANLIVEAVENHSYYVQQLAQTVWDCCPKTAKPEHVEEAIAKLMTSMNIFFQREADLLSNTQINFLKALCSGVEKFTSQEALQEFNLGSSSNITRIKQALIEKEVIDIINGKPEFSDPLFKIWFWRIYMQRR